MNDVPSYLQPGHTTKLGEYRFEPEGIIRFANKFDPQPFHVDEKLAKESLFGELCASGWHTLSAWMKLNRKHQSGLAMKEKNEGKPVPEWGPSPGMKDIKWIRPVYAGENISFSNRNETIRKSNSQPGWWIMDVYHEGVGKDGKAAISFVSTVFVRLAD